MSFFRRRLSKSDRDRDNRLSHQSDRGPMSPTSPPTSYNMPNGHIQSSDQHHSRPPSSAMSDGSYDFTTNHSSNIAGNPMSPTTQQNTSHRFANKPSTSSAVVNPRAIHAQPGVSHSGGGGNATLGNLSRTDQVVLRYFWEAKAEENLSRDLHFLKFPTFGHAPTDRELVPFCEIYALVKNSKGAEIVGLGSLGGSHGSGTFIGFELFSAAQLHIDLSDSWLVPISHHRVTFKPFNQLLSSSGMSSEIAQAVSSWPKPLTIEYLEEIYNERWARDFNAPCWESKEVRELGAGSIHNDEHELPSAGQAMPMHDTGMELANGPAGVERSSSGRDGR